MADVQKEKGFTPIAHELLEAAARSKFNGTQFRIILIVWRYTYGFNRKSHGLSISFIAEAIEVNKKQAERELQSLIDKNVIKVTAGGEKQTRSLSVNKDYESWKTENIPLIRGKKSADNKMQHPSNPLEALPSKKREDLPSNPRDKKERKKTIKKEEIRDMNIPSEKIKFHDTVYLTLEQYEKLCNEFGKHRVDNTIEALDEWQTNKKPSQHKKDHNKTIRVWIKKDLEKNKTSFKPKAQRNKEEMDILNQFYEEGAARETNGDGKLPGDDQDRLSLL